MIGLIQVFFSKYRFMLIGVTLALIIVVFFFLPKNQPIPFEPPLLFTDEELVKKNFPTYLSARIGETTDSEISGFPNRKEKIVMPDGSIQYIFPSTDLSVETKVVTKDGIAVFKNAVTVLPNTWEHPKASSYITQYGKPEREFTGSLTHGEFAKTYIYASRGFALVFNPFNNEVLEIQSFAPTTTKNYLDTWGLDVRNYSREGVEHVTEPL